MNTYKIYLAGNFIITDQKLDVENPYTQQVFATTYLAGKEELEIAITQAQRVQEELKNTPSFERYAILMHISNRLKQERERLGSLLSEESGKPIAYAIAEIDRSVQTFLIAAEESKRLPKEYISLDWTVAGKGKEGIIKYFPIGLVAGIAPFNFPMNLAVHKIAPAIAAGCPIILKPASSTPLSTLELAKIIDETTLPKGAVSILPMDRNMGNQLVTDNRFKLLSFTGSPAIGWKMKEQSGKKKVVLELGGNAGVIVTESANMEKALTKCLFGAFAYSGQICIHIQRIYVQENLFDDFVEEFKKRTMNLKFGNPQNADTQISVMIDEENALRIKSWVHEAKHSGAKILAGGKQTGAYYEPTIITNTSTDMKICALEAFGPIVIIEKYKTFEDAINMMNNSVFGIQAGIFTNNLKEANTAFNRLEVGGVIINDIPTFRVDHMPYGGIKESGIGREGIKYAILDMMEPRVMVMDNNESHNAHSNLTH